jgi:hypothetical protein
MVVRVAVHLGLKFKDRQVVLPELKLRHSLFLKEFQMTYLMHYLLEFPPSERIYVHNLIAQLPTQHAEAFMIAYRRRRKDPQTVLLAAVIGLVACPGFQRFWLGETGMGLLFLFTAGFLAMGSIIDLATYKTLAFSHNQKVARQIQMELGDRQGTHADNPSAYQCNSVRLHPQRS